MALYNREMTHSAASFSDRRSALRHVVPRRVNRAHVVQSLCCTSPSASYNRVLRREAAMSSICWQTETVDRQAQLCSALHAYYSVWNEGCLDSLDEVATQAVVYCDAMVGEEDLFGRATLKRHVAGLQASHPLLRFEVVSGSKISPRSARVIWVTCLHA